MTTIERCIEDVRNPNISASLFKHAAIMLANYAEEQLERQARLRAANSWKSHVDRMSGTLDDYEKDPNYHEMGH